MSTIATSTPKTPEQKHAAARQSQSMGRFGGVLILLMFLGLPALTVGTILYALTRRNRRRYAMVLIGMLVGMAIIGLGYRVLLAHGQALVAAWQPYGPAVREYVKTPSKEHWQSLRPLFTAHTPQIVQLWLIALPLAPCVAVYLESTRVKALPELRADKQRQEQQHDALLRREAARKVTQAPEQIQGKPVLGVPLGGALPDWRIRDWVTYPAELRFAPRLRAAAAIRTFQTIAFLEAHANCILPSDVHALFPLYAWCPRGQVTVWASQSIVKQAVSKPCLARACQL